MSLFLKRSDVVGRRIISALQSEWEPFEGTELEGIAEKTWYSCDCFLELESTGLIKVKMDTLVEGPVTKRGLIPPVDGEPQ